MITPNGTMKIWYLIASPKGCASGDTRVCSAYSHLEKAEKAIVALAADEDYQGCDGQTTDIDSPFEQGMCDRLEIWIEEIVVQ